MINESYIFIIIGATGHVAALTTMIINRGIDTAAHLRACRSRDFVNCPKYNNEYYELTILLINDTTN